MSARNQTVTRPVSRSVGHLARTVLFGALVTIAIALPSPALAGPPLLCHPFDIGSARSLPWGGPGWPDEQPGYNLANLADDTTSLLTRTTPVVVRMETLRRAAIYASRDRAVAAKVLTLLTERTRAFDPTTKKPDAVAWLDAGYFIEALRQIGYLEHSKGFGDRAPQMASLVKDLDGRAMVEKAVLLRPDDAGVEFAAALVNADKDRAAYQEHARRARAAADRDTLVAKNIAMVRED